MKTRLFVTNSMLTYLFGAALLVSSCEYYDEDDLSGSFEYPATGVYGVNFLSQGSTAYTTEWGSLQAKIPPRKKLKIVITALTPNGQTGVWSYEQGAHNWAVTNFDWNTNSQDYTSIDGGLTSVARISFQVGSFQIDYYENDSATPTTTKTIQVTE